jgi:hypothetical protein
MAGLGWDLDRSDGQQRFHAAVVKPNAAGAVRLDS